jgi:hypothetical protein
MLPGPRGVEEAVDRAVRARLAAEDEKWRRGIGNTYSGKVDSPTLPTPKPRAAQPAKGDSSVRKPREVPPRKVDSPVRKPREVTP